MTKLYSTQQLNAEHNNKEVGTLYREHVKFKSENKRSFSPVYHDEQVPIDTRYKQTEVGFEYVPRWTGGIVNDKWIQKVGAQLSVFSNGPKKEFQKMGEIEQQGKVWASQKEFKITMLGRPSALTIKDTTDEFDWMWRVFDKKHHFTDIDRQISIDWGSAWSKMLGSLPSKNMLEEEIKNIDTFFPDSDSENEALQSGDWRDVVEAHLHYYQGGGRADGVIRDIMKRYVDKLCVEDAVSVAFLAMCEFAKRISDSKEELNARFATSSYSAVRTAYRDALEEKDVINMKTTRQKSQDRRTLSEFLKEFRDQFSREATIDEIYNGTGFGERRVNSTFRMFDFNVGKYRPMNDEEMLYTVMNEHLTERQASIIEMNFGLNGTKWTMPSISEELGIGIATTEREKAKALKIIKEELNFKFS